MIAKSAHLAPMLDVLTAAGHILLALEDAQDQLSLVERNESSKPTDIIVKYYEITGRYRGLN